MGVIFQKDVIIVKIFDGENAAVVPYCKIATVKWELNAHNITTLVIEAKHQLVIVNSPEFNWEIRTPTRQI